MVFAGSKSGTGLTQRGVCTTVTFNLKLHPFSSYENEGISCLFQVCCTCLPAALMNENWGGHTLTYLHITQNAPNNILQGKTHLISAYESLLSINRKSVALPAINLTASAWVSARQHCVPEQSQESACGDESWSVCLSDALPQQRCDLWWSLSDMYTLLPTMLPNPPSI